MRPKFIISVFAIVLAIGTACWWIAEKREVPQASAEQVSQITPETRTEAPPVALKPNNAPQTTAVLPKRNVPALNLSKAPPLIRPIVDVQHNTSERFRLVRSLGKKLSRDELDFLFAFLRERHPEDDTQTGHALKSDLMDALCGQTAVPSDLPQLLIDVFQDRSQNVVVRDYALQHAPTLYERLDKRPRWQAAKGALLQVLWEASAETDSSIAGTALIGLCRLAEIRPEVDKDRLATIALKMARDLGVGDLTRVTALQVCARLQMKEALPLLAETAEKETETSLRISAIAGIGFIGGKNELSLLERIAGEGNLRLTPSLTAAVRRIREQIGQ